MGFFIIAMTVVLAVCFAVVIKGLDSDSKRPHRNTRGSYSDDTISPMDRYIQNIQAAAMHLRTFLAQVDSDPHAEYVLDHVGLGDDFSDESAETLHQLSPFRDWKITYFVAQDMIRCYKRLGHYLSDTDTPELLGLLIAFSKIALILLQSSFRKFASCVKTEGYEDELYFCVIFGRDVANPKFAQRYAVLMYRWASLVAKADGRITPKESEWLAHIMRQGNQSAALLQSASSRPGARGPARPLSLRNRRGQIPRPLFSMLFTQHRQEAPTCSSLIRQDVCTIRRISWRSSRK